MTLFILTFSIFVEIIIGLFLYFYVSKLEKKKKLDYKNKKRKIKLGQSQTKEASVDNNTILEEKE